MSELLERYKEQRDGLKWIQRTSTLRDNEGLAEWCVPVSIADGKPDKTQQHRKVGRSYSNARVTFAPKYATAAIMNYS